MPGDTHPTQQRALLLKETQKEEKRNTQMTKRQPEIVLNAGQRRLLKYYQGYSSLIAVSGGDTMLEPLLLIQGWSHRWDDDSEMADYIARHFASTGARWSPANLKKVLLVTFRRKIERF